MIGAGMADGWVLREQSKGTQLSIGKLRRVGELLFGARWQSELARALSPLRFGSVILPLNDRVVRRWSAGDASIPLWVWPAAVRLLELRGRDAEAYADHLRGLPLRKAAFENAATDEAPAPGHLDRLAPGLVALAAVREVTLASSETPSGEVIAKVIACAVHRMDIVYLVEWLDAGANQRYEAVSASGAPVLSLRDGSGNFVATPT